jgi:hypothetical protein
MIAGIFLGVMIGVAGMLLFAMYLGARKPQADKARDNVNSFSATSVSMGNQPTDAVQIDKELLTKILRAHVADKLIELPTTTRH